MADNYSSEEQLLNLIRENAENIKEIATLIEPFVGSGLVTKMGYTDISDIADGTATGAIRKHENDITEVNRNLTVRYNDETDVIEAYYEGTWYKVSDAGIQWDGRIFTSGDGASPKAFPNGASVQIISGSFQSVSLTATQIMGDITKNGPNGGWFGIAQSISGGLLKSKQGIIANVGGFIYYHGCTITAQVAVVDVDTGITVATSGNRTFNSGGTYAELANYYREETYEMKFTQAVDPLHSYQMRFYVYTGTNPNWAQLRILGLRAY